MTTYGTNYGYEELKIAKAVGDLLDGTADKYGSEYGYEELTLATAIAEQLGGSIPIDGNGGGGAFNGNRRITRTGLPNIIPGGETLAEFLDKLFYPSIAPGASISLNPAQKEFGEGTGVTVNWTATKQSDQIFSIIIGGLTILPTGNSQSGILSLQANPNTNTTFSVTVSDGTLSSSSSASIFWMNKRYWGRIPKNGISQPITDADILALTGAGVGTGSELANSRQKDYSGINGAGQYLIFAFPSAWGNPEFKAQGFLFTAMSKVRENILRNAYNYPAQYQVWVSNTVQFEPFSQFSIS